MSPKSRFLRNVFDFMQLDEITLGQRLFRIRGFGERVAEALQVATDIHQGSRRDEGTPYIRHPLRVALILAEELGIVEEDLICAALLHDVLEDGRKIDLNTLQLRFGFHIADLVRCLTDEFKNKGLPITEHKALYLQRIIKEADECLLIKLCDRLDNLRSLPYSPNVKKRARIAQDTRLYLMPVFQGKREPFSRLNKLMKDALAQLDK